MTVLTKHKSKTKKGFSLVELIVIISIMAVLALVVAGPILSYVERSRAKKDYSQASEIVQAVEMSLNDFEVFDEVETQKIKTNVSCYIDSKQESTYTPLITNETEDNKQYIFDDDSRKLDESPYYAAGNMDGLTITFEPKSSSGNKTKYNLADAVINKYAYGNSEQKLSDASPKLYQKLASVLGDTFEQESQTYRNSEYTVFVNTDIVEDETGLVLDAVNCYGQYDGTNLSLRDYPSTDVNITIDRENGTPSVPVEHQHNYIPRIVAPTCANDGYTEYRCACGKSYIADQTQAKGHTFKPYKVEPTCIAPGKSCEQCTSCGMIRNETVLPMVDHDYKTNIVKPTCDTPGHTEYICRNCGNSYIDKQISALGHDYKEIKTEPTCTKPGLLTYECSRCHAKKDNVTIPALGHQWSMKQFPPTCELDGYIEKTCDRCGYIETEKTGDKIEHNYAPGNIVKQPTCTTTGVREAVCSTCGNIKTEEIKVLGHDMTGKRQEPTCTQTGVSFETCRRCGHSNDVTQIPALGHDYQSTVIKPTCQHEGYTEKTCTRCDDVQKTNIIPATNHQYDVWTVIKSATCTAAGERTSMCVHCGYQIKEADPALGHNMQQKENPATCEQSGMKYKECTRCLIRIEETTINALGHSYTTKVIAPTCLAEGYTLNECTRCGMSSRNNFTPKIPHKYITWTITKQPTCIEAGMKQSTCAMCNTIATENIAPSGHKYKQITVGATCTIEGTTYQECELCRNRTPEKYIPPLGHDWVEKVIAPTCKNEGYTQRTCKRCAHEETANRVPAVAHNPSSWITTKEPTCTADGLRSATCSMCHQTFSEKIPALGHNFVTRTIDPTCIKEGQTREECSRCGELKGTPTIIEKIPHTYVDDVTPPTCEKGGQTTHTCAMCGHSYTDSYTDKIGHQAGRTEIKNPTFDLDGYKKVTCTFCGKEISNEILPKLSSLTAYALLLNDNSLHFVRSKNPFKVGDQFQNYGTVQAVDEIYEYFNPQMLGVVVPCWVDVKNQNQNKATAMTFHQEIRPTITSKWFMNYHGSPIQGFENLNTKNTRCMDYMFSNANFTELDLSHFDTGNVEAMNCMFFQSNALKKLNVSSFNTQNVTRMEGMFAMLNLNDKLDLSHFNTTKVQNMNGMFAGSHFADLDLHTFNTSNLSQMAKMFAGLNLDSKTLDLSSFDTSKITIAGGAFAITNLQTIYATDKLVFNHRDTNDQTWLFINSMNLVGGNGTKYSEKNHNTTAEETAYARIDKPGRPGYFTDKNMPSVTDTTAYGLLLNDKSLHFVRSKTPFKVGDSFENYGTIQEIYTKLEEPFNIQMMGVIKAPWIDRANQNKHKATSITFHHIIKPTMTNEWFMNYHGPTIKGFENLDTSNVRSMRDMFSGSNFTELDLSHFNTGAVMDMDNMFAGAQRLNGLDVSTFDLHNVQTMSGMFAELRFKKPLILNKFDTSSVRTMDRMFERSHFPALDLSGMKTQSCQTMNSMFASLQLDSGSGILDLTSFDTRNVKNMGFMFEGCFVSSINVSSFNTQSVTNMESMFSMAAPQTLDLTSFNTQHVTNACRMFHSSGMHTIYATDAFDMVREGSEPACNSTDMFEECWNLVGGNGTTYNMLHLDGDYAVIDSAATPGYFTEKEPAYGNDIIAIYGRERTNNAVPKLYIVKGSMNTIQSSRSAQQLISLDDPQFGFVIDDQANVPKNQIAILNIDYLNDQEYTEWGQDPSFMPQGIHILSKFSANDLKTMKSYNRLFAGLSEVQSITGANLIDFKGSTDLAFMFLNMKALQSINFGNALQDLTSVECMDRMFEGCSSLTSINANWNAPNIIDASAMFKDCSKLTNINLGASFKGPDRSSELMFYGCSSLVTANISNWKPAQRFSGGMFQNCSKLTKIYATRNSEFHWQGYDMFTGCISLPGYTASKTDSQMAKIGGYFTDIGTVTGPSN